MKKENDHGCIFVEADCLQDGYHFIVINDPKGVNPIRSIFVFVVIGCRPLIISEMAVATKGDQLDLVSVSITKLFGTIGVWNIAY